MLHLVVFCREPVFQVFYLPFPCPTSGLEGPAIRHKLENDVPRNLMTLMYELRGLSTARLERNTNIASSNTRTDHQGSKGFERIPHRDPHLRGLIPGTPVPGYLIPLHRNNRDDVILRDGGHHRI